MTHNVTAPRTTSRKEFMECSKREIELTVLNATTELLMKIYGKFEVNHLQTDRPDAAIRVTKPKKNKHGRVPFTVGIEITTVDPDDYLEYFNDQKHGRTLIAERIDKAIESQENIGQSSKYKATPIPDDYISSKAMRKSKKYANYMNGGKYREIVLLCFSELLEIKNEIFYKGLKQWTDYRLSSAGFPFDVVVFVDLKSFCAVRIYERQRPMRAAPPPYDYADATIERCESFLLCGQSGEFMNKNPLITPKKRADN